MRIHPLLGALALLAVLLLAACDSSGTSPAPEPERPATTLLTPTGTLTIAAKAWPVYVSGTYDKDSMLIIIKTDLDSNGYTGWLFSMTTLPGTGTRAIEKDTFQVPRSSAYYKSNANRSPECIYRIDGGSFRIDSLAAAASGKNGTGKMSGGASIVLTPFYTTPDCEGLTAELTFSDADATDFDAQARAAAK